MEARPIAREEQRVWFGGGGKDLVLVSHQDPFSDMLYWESIFTKIGRKLVGTILCMLGSEDNRD